MASPYIKRDDVSALSDLIDNAAVSISTIVDSASKSKLTAYKRYHLLTCTPSSAKLTEAGPSPSLGEALSAQVDQLSNTYEKLSDDLGDATHLSSDFASDPRVIEINNSFTTLLSVSQSTLKR